MLLAEALTLAAGAVPGADAGAVAVDVELAMLRQVRASARAFSYAFLISMQALRLLCGKGLAWWVMAQTFCGCLSRIHLQ